MVNKPSFDQLLGWSPAQPMFHWRTARQLTVLAYHGIDEPERFHEQLGYLVKHLYPVTLEEVLCAAKGQRNLPRHAVLLTFDDGERTIFENGLPLLRDRGIPGVVFVVTSLVDTATPFWWHEVKELIQKGGSVQGEPLRTGEEWVRFLKQGNDAKRLAILAELRRTATGGASPMPQLTGEELCRMEAAGLTIGNHTLTHPCLTQCGTAKVEQEITEAHQALSAILGHAPAAFAYPNGDADQRAEKVLNNLGYQAAFLFDHRLNALPLTNRLRISRVRVNSHTSLERFKIIVSGLHPAIHRARGGR
jgi:peptidoglycan/xylan/chitin deacetylase (PgdA/CDA1 family)